MDEVRAVCERIRSGRLREVIPGALEPPQLPPCGDCHTLHTAKRFDSQNGHKSENNGVVLGIVVGDDNTIRGKSCAWKRALKKYPGITSEEFEAGLKPYDEKLVPGLYIFKPRASQDSP